MSDDNVFDALVHRKNLFDVCVESIQQAQPERRAPLIAQARELIDQIVGPSHAHTVTGEDTPDVISFKDRLAKRQSRAANQNRPRKSS
ncbi:hypothetical protein [Schaalia sp. lx-260]|uniref:hypothetical protein n=1 Tax=Schaalia sp. lx-260 TaxID=2899082 RepID=UPI001E4B3ABB|nr:hypothetical protein [Schaalia sp. lx-260]MCD4549688.1 hypothetical protein [Schaalia sp. lx-260]